MRKKLMKSTMLFTVTLGLLLLPSLALAHEEGDPYLTNLTADGGSLATAESVGDVGVWNDAENIYVVYVLDNPYDPENPQIGQWCITQTHLAVEDDLSKIPQTKKNSPIPGLFAYGDEALECVGDATYAIPNAWVIDTELYIAAHAKVQELIDFESDLPGFEEALPDQVSMRVSHPGSGFGDPSYFDVTVSGGTSLDGIYDSFCIDTDHTISPGSNYTANIYSSYETLPAGLVEYPENLDLVNWIINQGFVGQPSPGCSGNYTYGDVQRAIWELVEDTLSTSGLGSWSQCRVNEIIAAAQAYGEGFEPECGDFIAVILVPINDQQIIMAQVTAIEVGIPCKPVFDGETAWGGPYPDNQFNGKDWSIYFTYEVQ